LHQFVNIFIRLKQDKRPWNEKGFIGTIYLMKSEYFTVSNLDQAAKQLLDGVRGLQRKPETSLAVGASCLLVLDMQAYFLDPGSHAFVPSAPAILPRILSLVDLFSQKRRMVVFTKHINHSDDAGMMSSWWQDLITEDHPGCQITTAFDVTGHTVIQKGQYDAFYETQLGELLKERKITDVIVTGVMTHLCCETTARSAFMRGFQVWFPVDGTATYNQEFHLASLRNLAHGFAMPTLVSQLIDEINKHEG
jgi:nicotinamidase-related amidase